MFDENGVHIHLSPITILTGCNNSGKSSYTRALLLVQDFCRQVKSDVESGRGLHLERYKLDFHVKPNQLLGNFNNILHRGSDNNEDSNKHIIYEFELMSPQLLQDVIVRLEFSAIKEDKLNDGYLYYISIKTVEGKVLYESTRGGNTSLDFSCVKKDLLRFIDGQRASAEWQNLIEWDIYESMEDDPKEWQSLMDAEKALGSCFKIVEGWQALHGAGGGYDGVSKVKAPIIGLKMDDNTPVGMRPSNLGVFCYFPCMDDFKGMKKEEVINVVKMRVLPHVNANEQEIVNLLLSAFETSGVNSLHEFVSQKEDEELFVCKKVADFRGWDFPMPDFSWTGRTNRSPYDETEAYFHVVLSAMDIINQVMRSSDEKFEYTRVNLYNSKFISVNVDDNVDYKYTFDLEKLFQQIIAEILNSLFSGYLSYLPAETLLRRRMYSLEEGHDFELLLKRYFDAQKRWRESRNGAYWTEKEKYVPGTFLNHWLQSFNVAHHFDIESHAEGLGIIVRLYADENDEKGMILVDKGLGIMQLFAILLNIETTILEKLLLVNKYDPNELGLVKNTPEEIKKIKDYLSKLDTRGLTTIILEEPEVHLHPNFQSLLAEMMYDAYSNYDIHFIVETHSEYLIRKLQVMVADKENALSSDDVSLNYVEKDEGGISHNRQIKILEDGSLSESFGSGFYDEADTLAIQLFRNKPILS